jgi:ketosteroid isomerase-like protein
MFRILVLLALLVGAPLALRAQPTDEALAPIEQAFLERERAWHDAIQRQDIPALEAFLAPEYTLTVAVTGEPLYVTERADYIEACRGFYVIHAYAFDEVAVRDYGDVAVVSSRYRQRATLGGTEDRSAEFFLTDVWVRRDGRWQVSARYSSRPEPSGQP